MRILHRPFPYAGRTISRSAGIISVLLLAVALLCQSCTTKSRSSRPSSSSATPAPALPHFSADSAYRYVAEQCAFGARVPGSDAHACCARYLVAHFLRHGADTVIEQRGTTRLYDSREVPLLNIIASYRPDLQPRILICAHYDSRPFADEEPLEADRQRPILGANDGASGVAVIMELARHLSSASHIGVDLILFDLEDWGAPDWAGSALPDGGWALGSAYWAEHPHIAGYKARYGILLDMVGASGARFYREYMSQQYAPWVNDILWSRAADIGYSSIFVDRIGGAVTDDHLNVIRAGIPCIDIIQHDPSSPTGFYDRWHTLADDLSAIDPATLSAVGSLLINVIFD